MGVSRFHDIQTTTRWDPVSHVSESVIGIDLPCIKHIVHCLNFPSLGYRLAILQRFKDQSGVSNTGNRG